MNDCHLEISRPCKDLYTSTDRPFFIVDISKAHILSLTHVVFERPFRVQKRRWFILVVFGFGFSVQWQNAIEERSDFLLNGKLICAIAILYLVTAYLPTAYLPIEFSHSQQSWQRWHLMQTNPTIFTE